MMLRNFSVLFLLTLSLTLVLMPITNVYAVVPGQVTGLTATAQTNALTIDLSWTAVTATPAVTGYKIERKIGAGAFSTLVANTGTTATTYSDTGLSQGTTYTYRVSAINADGTGPASAEASATTNSAPGAPTGLTATKQTNALTIDLSWTAPASNGGSAITGYKIERESPVGGGFSTLVANTGTTATTYSDTGLSANTQYNYRVSAINAIGTGSASSTASATTNNVPGTPTGLTATAQADVLTINLSWTTPSSDGGSAITGYKIERKIGTGAFSTLVANTASTSTSYSDTGLSQGTQYTYRVSAINAIGTGSASGESSATTSDVPATPTLSISVTKFGISLSWTTPNNMGSSITGYKIERASPAGSAFGTLVGNTGTTSTILDSSVGKQQSVSYRISAINAIGTGNPSSEVSAVSLSSGACNVCNAPSFNEERVSDEFPLEIAGKAFKIPSHANKIDTVSARTGTTLPIKLSLYDDSGPEHIQHVALYLNLKENQLTESQSDTYIIWEKGQEVVVYDPHGLLKDTKVTAQISSEDNQELEVTFDLFFVKPLEKSHIIVSMWDDKRNGSIVKILDALKVKEGDTQTDQDLIEEDVQNTPTISERLKEEIKKIAKDGITDVDVAFMLSEMTKEGIDFKELDNKQKEMSLMEAKVITSESQDGRVSVEKGYSSYYELLTVKGEVSDYTVGTTLGLEITKPEAATQTLSLYADKNGYFHVPIMLDDIKDGTFVIKASYKDATIGELKFTLDSKPTVKTGVSNVENIVRLWLQEKITDENFLERIKQIVD